MYKTSGNMTSYIQETTNFTDKSAFYSVAVHEQSTRAANFSVCYNMYGRGDIRLYVQSNSGYASYVSLPITNNSNMDGWATVNFADVGYFSLESYMNAACGVYVSNGSAYAINKEDIIVNQQYSIAADTTYTLYLF